MELYGVPCRRDKVMTQSVVRGIDEKRIVHKRHCNDRGSQHLSMQDILVAEIEVPRVQSDLIDDARQYLLADLV